jgi:Flp pilus assembly pilin Flp
MIKVMIQKVAKNLTRLPRDERATALMEYSLLLGMVVVAVISIILFAGQWVSAQWQALSSGLSQTPNQP